MSNRSVFHIRVKDFEIQAERMLDASLRTRPIAIISAHHQNGTIINLSKEAKQEGLQTGMKVSLARKMSHSALLLPYNSALYHRMNQYIYKTVSSYSPLVEPEAYGQYYVDMTGMDNIYKSLMQAGHRIARDIQFKINLKSLVGISSNKLVSRISTAVVPEPIYEVPTGNEPKFLAPLPSQILPSTQEPAVKRIIKFLFLKQVKNIQEIVEQPGTGAVLFGKRHRQITMEAMGQDTSLVKPRQYRNHIMEQIILPTDTNDEDVLRAMVQNLAEQVAFQLRQRKQVSKNITVEIHYTDGFKNARKGAVLFNDDKSVTDVCLKLFTRAKTRRNRVRSILIDATKLQLLAQQLDLFSNSKGENLALSNALDKIRQKYGFNSIKSAANNKCFAI